MSSDKRPPYHRRVTRPVPRAELPPPASTSPELEPIDQDEVLTLVPCPCCDGLAMVTPEKAADIVSRLLEPAQETA